MRVALAIFAASLLAQDPPPAAPAKEPAFKSLCETATLLDRGIAAFLADKPPAEAYKPWEAINMTETHLKELRDEFKKKEVASARTFAFELDLEFMNEGKPIYVVEALVHATPTETLLLGLRGHRIEPPGKNGLPIDRCVKESAPFGEAGAVLLKLLKANKPGDLPFADGEAIADLAPMRFKGQVVAAIEKSKTGASDVCRAVSGLSYGEVRVQVEEQFYTPYGADAKPRDGFINAKLNLKETGGVEIRLNRYQIR